MLLRTFMLVALMMPLVSYGSIVTAELKAGTWRWISGVPSASGINDHIVPSRWNVASGLPPTTEVVLGGATDTNEKNILLSSAGQSVSLPVTIVGFEYNLGELSSKYEVGSSQSGTPCNMYGSLNSNIGLTGDSLCILENSYKISSELESATPYAFIRPIIKFPNSEAIISAFSGKPTGKYIGAVPVTSFYDYYIPGSSIKTRKYSVDVVNVEINYEPAFVSKVTVSGSGNIPSVNFKNETVSGFTKLKIDAEGWFSNGLTVSLKPTRNVYEMKGPLLTTIPYSIDCVGCLDHQLVESGSVINMDTSVPGNNTANISFDIDVSFSDIDLDTLENGDYSDTFILLIEAGL